MRSPYERGAALVRAHLPLVAICAAIFAVRLVLAGYMHHADPRRFVTIDSDSKQYEQLAVSLLEDGSFTDPGSATGEPEFLRTPGYPAFIAAIYGVFGEQPVAVIVVQILLATGVLIAVYRIGTTLFSPRAGLFAAAITALDPVHTNLSLILMTDSISTLLSVFACLLVVILVLERRSPWVALACGTTLAVATMVRPINYYLIGAVVFGLIVVHRAAGYDLRKLGAVLGAFLIPAVVILGSWHLRNYGAVGSAQFSGITGRNLLQYRAAAVHARKHDMTRKEAIAVLRARVLAETDSTKHMHERQMEMAKRYLLSDIPGTVSLVGFGAVRLLLDPGAADVLKLFGAEPVAGTQGMTNSMSASIFTYLNRWSGGNPWATSVILGALAYLGLLYLLTAVGATRWLAGPREQLVAHLFVAGFVLYYLLVSAGGEGLARFRAPFAPLLAIYAGAGLAWLTNWVRDRRAARAVRPIEQGIARI